MKSFERNPIRRRWQTLEKQNKTHWSDVEFNLTQNIFNFVEQSE